MSRSELVRLRVSVDEKAAWSAAAADAGLDLSSWLRRCARDAIALERAVARADAIADRRAQRLGELPPTRIEELRERGGDWTDWPELDEEAGV